MNEEKEEIRFIWISAPDGTELRLPTRKTPDGFYEVIDPKGFTEEILKQDGVPLKEKPLEKETFNLTLEELRKHSKGVLTHLTKEEEYKAILRCELIFELWRVLGGGSKTSGLDEVELKKIEKIASAESYYQPAVKWMVKQGKGYFPNMYDWVDIANPITWAEVAYLFYCELDFRKKLDWKRLGEKYETSALINEEKGSGVKTLEMDVNKYKSSVYFTDYLRHIREGKRLLPYPLVGCYEELRESGIVNHLRTDDILREVTRKEAKVLINILQKIQQGN